MPYTLKTDSCENVRVMHLLSLILVQLLGDITYQVYMQAILKE